MKSVIRPGRLISTCVLSAAFWGGIATLAPAHAEDDTPSLMLEYTCVFPLLEEQPLTVAITAEIPDTVPVGELTEAFRINAEALVSGQAGNALDFLGSRTLSGTVQAQARIDGPALTLDLSVPMTVPEQAMPGAPGDFQIDAQGETPPLIFEQQNAGEVAIRVEHLVMTLRPLDAQGALTGIGEFEAECLLEPDQDNVLHTLIVGEGSAGGEFALPISGQTLIRAADGMAALQGQISGVLEDDGALAADMHFAPAHTRLHMRWLLRLLMADAELLFEPVAQTRGHLDSDILTTETLMHVRVPAISVRMLGLPLLSGGGETCRTATPITLHLATPSGGAFDVEAGGVLEGVYLEGTYDMPTFENCGGLESFINLFMTGTGNRMALAMGLAPSLAPGATERTQP
ncbi:DUF6801 domain-containing protein [Isoalcanivorax indicus]|uniref:DUF6801 domain-containing protein n=1 Tax=Isoalcanivorax indicus TaxID=2202653 RepID=UPI000DB9E73C|nr:DUF6801 domain-containing protein [Isoalcanivorax indicus]